MSDLDNEELIATRKLYGLDDDLFKEETMSEEAFNELIDNIEVVSTLTMHGRKGIKENVKKLQARIRELEEKDKKKSIECMCYQEELENSIPVQKVKDKIEDLQYNNSLGFEETLEETLKIEVLEELLEDK